MVDAELMLETDTKELTVSVENEPVPGALLLILDTVRVERARKDAVTVLPVRVEYDAIGAVILVVMVRVLPVRVDKLIVAAFTAAKFDERKVK